MSVVHGTTNEGRSIVLEGFDSFKILSKVSGITEMLPRFVRESVPAKKQSISIVKRAAVCWEYLIPEVNNAHDTTIA